jgi:hypothetical protein
MSDMPPLPENNAVDKYITVTIDNEVVHNILLSHANGENFQDRLIAIYMSNPTFTLNDKILPVGSTFPPVE